MDRMVAFCGLVCTDCPAYIATQADDRDALEALIPHMSQGSTIEDALCDGCLTVDGRLVLACRNCQVQACGQALGLPNCAHCDEYVCGKLEPILKACDERGGVWEFARQTRGVLEGIRAGLEG
jgi:hypothetical protein